MPATYTDRLDGLTTSVAVKAPCRVATTVAITLSGLQTVDGVTVEDGDRVLVKNQSDAADHGIYRANASTWTRTLDFDGSRDVVGGTLLRVNQGTINANSYWEVSGNGPLIPGTDDLNFIRTKEDVVVNVMEFGAVGNGATDDRAAIALAAAAARGKRLYFPEGNYLINTDGGSITLEEVSISGTNVLDGANLVLDEGVNFLITGTTNSPFKFRRGVTFDGVGFYYPNQPNTATPTVYPPTLDGDFTNGAIQFLWVKNCVVYNAYDFIRANDAAGNIGHCWIEDNTIFAFRRAISITHNQEVIKLTSNTFTFGHWLVATEAGAAAFYRLNGVNLYVEKSDGLWIEDNLFFGALSGIHCAVTGLCQQFSISGNSFDQTRYGIRATGSGNFIATISGGNQFYTQNTQAPLLQGRSIEINTTGIVTDMVVVTGNQFHLSSENHIYVAGVGPTRRDLTISGNIFRAWAYGKLSGNWGAVDGSNLSNLNIDGNWFDPYFDLNYSSGIVGSMNSLSCNGNSFLQCLNAVSVTTSYATGSGNASYATRGTYSDVISSSAKVWGPNQFDKPQDFSPLTISIGLVGNYVDDAAAALGGVGLGGLYRNGSIRMIRAV